MVGKELPKTGISQPAPNIQEPKKWTNLLCIRTRIYPLKNSCFTPDGASSWWFTLFTYFLYMRAIRRKLIDIIILLYLHMRTEKEIVVTFRQISHKWWGWKRHPFIRSEIYWVYLQSVLKRRRTGYHLQVSRYELEDNERVLVDVYMLTIEMSMVNKTEQKQSGHLLSLVKRGTLKEIDKPSISVCVATKTKWSEYHF